MIYTTFPVSTIDGWGVAGKSLSRALSKLTTVQLLTHGFDANTVGDPLEYAELAALVPPGTAAAGGFNFEQTFNVAGPLLQPVSGPDMAPYRSTVKSQNRTVGYTFFEDDVFLAQRIANAERYDAIATGSNWNRDVLIAAGYSKAETVLQGVDPRLFNPHLNDKEYFRDRFVIFSGGKLELRKGQDIAMRAFKALRQKHSDVMLVNQWYNGWPNSLATMAESRLIKYEQRTNDYFQFINQLLHDNGIDPKWVLSLPPMQNQLVGRIYKNTDVGLFPNRCEGGTNLVMTEYMACGKPVIGAFNTGQRDVLTDANSLRIMDNTPLAYHRAGQHVANWFEPSLDEAIAHLEWAYDHRRDLALRGIQAGQDIARLTWPNAAQQFLKLLTA